MKSLLFFLLLLSSATDAQTVALSAATRSPYNLMNLITRHQLQEIVLKDGTYPKGNWDIVKTSKLPTAMYWSYPAGVSLLGMQRVFDITKSEDIINFVKR